MEFNIDIYHYYLDVTQCDCISTSYFYGVNQGGGSLICLPCNLTNYVCVWNWLFTIDEFFDF
jgi:hypothetical protein